MNLIVIATHTHIQSVFFVRNLADHNGIFVTYPTSLYNFFAHIEVAPCKKISNI